MKTYIGIKPVEAVPMTRGEYNEYRRWNIPAGENPNDAGYLVRYPDGYESWSPSDVFEEAYTEKGINQLVDTCIPMKSDDYKERFRAEFQQVKIRYDRLHNMIIKYEANALNFSPKTPLEILKKQASAMGQYLYHLEVRAEIENVEL